MNFHQLTLTPLGCVQNRIEIGGFGNVRVNTGGRGFESHSSFDTDTRKVPSMQCYTHVGCREY